MQTKNAATLIRILAPVALAFALAVGAAWGQSVTVRNVRRAVLTGRAKYLRPMPPTQQMLINVTFRLHHQAELNKLLAALADPSNPEYGHYLTQAQFVQRFGPTKAEFRAVVAYLAANGLTVIGGGRGQLDVQARGPAAAVERAFHVKMGIYQHPTENRTFFAPDRQPTTNLPFPIWHVSGLDNYSIPHPMFSMSAPGAQAYFTGSGPGGDFLGSDMRAAYYYAGGPLTGAGQDVALLELTSYDIADVYAYYDSAPGQSLTASIQGVSVDGYPIACSTTSPYCGPNEKEDIVDITQALGMAPGIGIVYVYVGDPSIPDDVLGAMENNNDAKQLSSSWAWNPSGGTLADDPYFEEFSSAGKTFFQASGDFGSYPSSSYQSYMPPEDDHVVAVGGTVLTTESAGGPWKSETAWSSSGGGISPDGVPIPSWQQDPGVINQYNGGSTQYRNVPDVAANAVGVYFCQSETTQIVCGTGQGTSASAPMWAGFMALVNQQNIINNRQPPGTDTFLTNLYSLGSGGYPNYEKSVYDITSGSNGGFSATGNFDLVTGWGSPSCWLIDNLTGAATCQTPSAAASPTSLSFYSQNDQPVTEQAVLTNNGPGTMIGAVSLSGNAAFYISTDACGTYLGQGQSCVVYVTFAPGGCLLGNVTGTLTFSNDSSELDQTVSLSGKTSSCTLTPTGAAAAAPSTSGALSPSGGPQSLPPAAPPGTRPRA